MSGDEPAFQLISSVRYDKEALLFAQWNTSRNGGKQSPYLLLRYTVDRFIRAAKTHSWATPSELTLDWLESRCDASLKDKDLSQPYKVLSWSVPQFILELIDSQIRIVLSQQGDIWVEPTPIPKLNPPGDLFITATLNPTSALVASEALVDVYLDTEPTSPSVFTSTKTTRREAYNLARTRVDIPAIGVEPGTPKDVVLHRSDGQVMETSIRNIAFWRMDRWVTPPLQVGCLPGVARRLLMEEGKIVEGYILIADLKVGDVVLLFNAVEGARLGKICTPNGRA
jgi:4-amino-4-deoxychorismate lyase